MRAGVDRHGESVRGRALWSIVLALAACSACAQHYPAKPVRMLTAAVGGDADFTARLVARALSARMGRQFVVDNRSAILSETITSEATPDGYTVLVATSSLWLAPLLQKMPFDPLQDFSPISLLTSSPNVLVVNPAVPATSVQTLVRLAKVRPGKLDYASGVTGSSSHLAAALFDYMAGIHLVRIPYKGGAAALADLMGGRIQVMFPNVPSVKPHLDSGRLRALAVTSAQPTALLPGLPTIASAGFPGYEAALAVAMLAPARTPEPIVRRLDAEIAEALKEDQLSKALFAAGVEGVATTPAQLAHDMRREIERMRNVVQAQHLAVQ